MTHSSTVFITIQSKLKRIRRCKNLKRLFKHRILIQTWKKRRLFLSKLNRQRWHLIWSLMSTSFLSMECLDLLWMMTEEPKGKKATVFWRSTKVKKSQRLRMEDQLSKSSRLVCVMTQLKLLVLSPLQIEQIPIGTSRMAFRRRFLSRQRLLRF